MKILFIDPPNQFGSTSESGGRGNSTSPLIGILYLSSFIKAKLQADVRFVDSKQFFFSKRSLRELFRDYQPDLIGVTAKTFNILEAYNIAALAKESGIVAPIIVGGAHATALPYQTLEECEHIDAIVKGEGEVTFLDICQRLDKKLEGDELFIGIPGLLFRSNRGEFVDTGPRSLIADLDNLPFPDYSIVDYSKYIRIYNPIRFHFQHVFPILGSRGCPFHCTFCMPLFTRKRRERSIESILAEVEILNKRFGAQRIYFEDSLFSPTLNWLETFCESYKQRGLHKKVQWGFETRIDTLPIDAFRIARDAGCIYAFFGVESGNETVLKKNRKPYTRDKILAKTFAAKQAGISVAVSIILGLPFESTTTISDTITLLNILPCDSANINIMDVYPGTQVEFMVEKNEGGLRWKQGRKPTWEEFSRDTVMVEVNDLQAADLLRHQAVARKVMSQKSRSKSFSYFLKAAAYSRELMHENPKLFFKYAADVFYKRR